MRKARRARLYLYGVNEHPAEKLADCQRAPMKTSMPADIVQHIEGRRRELQDYRSLQPDPAVHTPNRACPAARRSPIARQLEKCQREGARSRRCGCADVSNVKGGEPGPVVEPRGCNKSLQCQTVCADRVARFKLRAASGRSRIIESSVQKIVYINA